MSLSLCKIPLKEITVTQKGAKPEILKSKEFPESIPYLDINALETGRIKEYTHQNLGNLSTTDDVLVVWDGSRSGLALKGKFGAIGSTLMKITPIGLYPDYLYYFLQSKFELINGNITGSGIPHVNSELFYNLEIPYVSLDIQKQVINELLAKLEANAQFLDRQDRAITDLLSSSNIDYKKGNDIHASIESFKSAVLQKAISGSLTEQWRAENGISFPDQMTSLKNAIIEIKSGKSFRCLERPPKDGEIGVLKISAISSYSFNEKESKTCNDQEKINSDLFIQLGDFLVCRANTKELVGSCAIVKKIEKNIMLSDKIWRVKFDDSIVLDEYIYLFLRSKAGRNQIENAATGSQESMKNITHSDFQGIKIYIPKLSEQKKIIKKANDGCISILRGIP